MKAPAVAAGPHPEPVRPAAAAPSPPREAAPARPPGGALADRTGPPALLTWTALLPEFAGVVSANDLDFERVRSVTATARADASGRFEFAWSAEGASVHDSIVWVTQPAREAVSIRLDPSAAPRPWPEIPPGPPRDPVRVLVRRGGEPVAGARVRHTLRFVDVGLTAEDVEERRLFLRDLVTDAGGAAELAPGSGQNVLVASDGGERSLLWYGEPAGEVVLELLPEIEVAGRIRTSDPGLAFGEVRYFVAYVGAADDSDFVWAGSSRAVRADGTFGPEAWPRAARRTLEVRVQGGELVPASTRVPNPPAGERAFVELDGERALPFEVAVTDPDGGAIQGVSVQAFHVSRSAHLPLERELTDAEGRATVFAPEGLLALRVSKPGHASLDLPGETLLVPQAAPPLRLVLRRAGVVAGFVHCGSEPVRRFTVLAWDEDKAYNPVRSFDDEEGAFRLDDVPIGETVHLLAYTEAQPQSETLTFVLEDELSGLELELPVARKARGRVVDALTGAPIATARLHHLVAGMTQFAGYRGGRGMGVQADGSFELDGFSPGRGGFACFADGYETLFYSTREGLEDVVDVGLLALNPMSALVVTLRDPGVTDFGGYRAWNGYNDDTIPVPFPAAGTLVLPSRSGHYELHVVRPDDHVASATGTLLPGEEKPVTVDFGAGIELALTLADPPAGVGEWSVTASGRTRETDRSASGGWSRERRAFVVRPAVPGPNVLELRDTEGELVSQCSVVLSDAPQQTLELSLRGVERRIRLQDSRGRPWASATVHVTLPEPSGWSHAYETDLAGELVIGPLDARRVVLAAKLANESIAWGVEVELEPDPARTSVVEVDVGPRSMLRLAEEGRAVPGLHVIYTHEKNPRKLTFGYVSDEHGIVRGPFLGPGTYGLVVNHRDYWPSRHLVPSRDTEDPLPVELHGRATLALAVSTPAGRPLAGTRVDLRHLELDEDAAAWIEAGWIAPRGGLVTDGEGELVLEGIPRGEYAWTCTTARGTTLSGRLRLRPRERLELPIRIEEE